jgi:hypothetical protein
LSVTAFLNGCILLVKQVDLSRHALGAAAELVDLLWNGTDPSYLFMSDIQRVGYGAPTPSHILNARPLQKHAQCHS